MGIETATSDSSSRQDGGLARHRYCVYGVAVVSDTPLGLPTLFDGGLGEIEYRSAPRAVSLAELHGLPSDAQSDSWYEYAVLRDGSTYVRWKSVGEFLVAADGRRITGRRHEGSPLESFQVYMLGQALSFALVKQRFEPLHATVVVVDDQAVAFLGHSAFGKSTLAACFVAAGHRLLTDDLLILHESGGRILAYPGPPRIKLFPQVARQFLGHVADRIKMNPDTDKLILAMEEHRSCAAPVTLKAVYSLAAPGDVGRHPTVKIENLSVRDGFVALVRATFNRRIVGSLRLERQFCAMSSLAETIPIRKLSYPRAIDRLQDVREMVIADLARDEMSERGRPCPFPFQRA